MADLKVSEEDKTQHPQVKLSEVTSFNMATLPTRVRVGVNFSSSEQEDLIVAYSTIDPTDTIVTKWHLVRPEVIDIIKQLPWAILSVVRGNYGSSEPTFSYYSPAPPEKNAIVLVGAPMESQSYWQAMAERIYSLCRNTGLENIHVLFESVRYPLTATDPLDPSTATDAIDLSAARFPETTELANNVPMGSSFGPIEEEAQISASMGGSIKLQKTSEEPLTLLLSVFHPFTRLVKKEELLHGYRHDSTQPIKSKMPSMQDIGYERKFRQSQIRQLEEKIELYKQNFELSGGEEKFLKNIDKFEEYLQENQAGLRKLDNHTSGDQGSGILQYGSGFEKGLNWSLSLFKDRNINNVPPTSIQVATAMAEARVNHEDSGPALQRYGFPTVVNLSKPEIDSLVIKRGRSSRLTAGKVNAIPSDLVISKSLKLKKEVSFEVRAILSGRDTVFLCDGDSGAWVLNMEGDWIGSIVGTHGPKNYGGDLNIALFVEAEKIVEDIEAFTGMKVVSPGRSGY